MRDVGAGFGRRIARERAAEMLPLCADWRPELLLCEELDFGSMIIAEPLPGPEHAITLLERLATGTRPLFAV